MKKIILLFVFLIAAISMVQGATNTINDLSRTQLLLFNIVNQDPDPALAGDVVEVRLGVQNIGGLQADNLMLEIVPEYPFSLLAGESATVKIGTLNAYQDDENMQIVKFQVRVDKDATAGTYDLILKYYEDGTNIKTQRSFPIEVDNSQSAEVIYIDQVELIPGKITPLKFTINNVGSAPLRELTFKWENAEDIILPVGSDNTKYIKYIDVGGKADLSFDVIASAIADPNLYKLDLTLTYTDPLTGAATELDTKAGVYVGGATDFDVAFSGTSNGESSFSIANIGSVSATSVTVNIPDQQGWRVSGTNSVIIGNLNEGDYTIASFTLQPSRQGTRVPGQTNYTQMPASSTVQIQILYTDSRGNRNTVTKDVAIDSASFTTATAGGVSGTTPAAFANGRVRPGATPATSTNWKWYVIGAVVIVLFIFVHGKRSRGRLKNPRYGYGTAISDMIKRK